MKYTFFNTGSYFRFNPLEMIFPYKDKPAVRNIDFYQEKVQEANSKDVFILDEIGNDLMSGLTYQEYSKNFKKVLHYAKWPR